MKRKARSSTLLPKTEQSTKRFIPFTGKERTKKCFQLQPDSPAIDAGDPGHAPDADGSRSDIGAYYTYDPAHYPWTPSTTVVIDEVLAHSGPDTPDWIELYNRSSQAVDISGWFLSDSPLDLRKYRIPDGTTLPAGGRIVCVGTTSLRLLESATAEDGEIKPFHGDTAIFITPGYRFRAADVLMTNFHLPKSTLFMLVSAFAGLETMRAAYAHAVKDGYRFYSYGDGSLLFRAA